MNGSSLTNSSHPLDGDAALPEGIPGATFDDLQAALGKQRREMMQSTLEFLLAQHTTSMHRLRELFSDYHVNAQAVVETTRGGLQAPSSKLSSDGSSLAITATSEGSIVNIDNGITDLPRTCTKTTKFDTHDCILEFKPDADGEDSQQASDVSQSRILKAKQELKKRSEEFGDASMTSSACYSSSPVRLQQAKSSVEDSYAELMKQLRDESLVDTLLWKFGVTGEDIEKWQKKVLTPSCKQLQCVRRLTRSAAFQAMSLTLIFFNSVYIAVDLDSNAESSADAFYQRSQGIDAHTTTRDWSRVLDYCFCGLFSFELLLRFLAEELSFFFGKEWRWNLLDTVLVLTSIADVMVHSSTSDGSVDMSFVRILRLCRLVRTLRVIRIMRFFRELRLIMLSIISAIGPLLWALVFLTLIMFLIATVFLQGMTNYVNHAAPNDPIAVEIIKHFPDFPKTMLTLFMSITGGLNWIDVQAVVAEVSEAYRFVFLWYIALMVLGVLNIITGIFVESSGELAQLDRDLVTQVEMEKNNLWMKELTKIFKELDKNGNGIITLEEFTTHASKDDVQAFFGALQLDVTKAVDLFELLDVDGSLELEIDEFVIGCMRLKGMAKSIDMETVLAENRKLGKRWAKQFHSIEKSNHRIISQLASISALGNRTLSKLGFAEVEQMLHDEPPHCTI